MPGYRHRFYAAQMAVSAEGAEPVSICLQHPLVLRRMQAVVNGRDARRMTDGDRAAAAGMLVLIGSPETVELMLAPVPLEILMAVHDEPCLDFDDEPIIDDDGTPQTYEVMGLELSPPALLDVESVPIVISWADKAAGLPCDLSFVLTGSENDAAEIGSSRTGA